ncbi:hypothetical protein JTP64_000183 [Candida tropicalis]|nr:hypothetical protein JTP64_000183 [Candida tropicalis]
MKLSIFLQILLIQSITSAQFLTIRAENEDQGQHVGPLVASSTYDPYAAISPLPTKSTNSSITNESTTSSSNESSTSAGSINQYSCAMVAIYLISFILYI